MASRSGRIEASLEDLDSEVEGWLLVLPEVRLPVLTGADIAGVVRRKTATGWVGLEGDESSSSAFASRHCVSTLLSFLVLTDCLHALAAKQ